MAESLQSVLSSLLGSYAATFLTQVFGRHPLVVPGEPGRFVPIYSIDRLARREHWRELEARRVDANGEASCRPLGRRDVEAALAQGESVQAELSAEASVRQFLVSLGWELGLLSGSGRARLTLAPEGHGLAMHGDQRHLFMLQLAGTQLVVYGETPLLAMPPADLRVAPDRSVWLETGLRQPLLDAVGEPLLAPRLQELSQIELGPGDLLYLPPGTLFQTVSRARSLSLDLSPPRHTTWHLLRDLLESQLLQFPALRADLPWPAVLGLHHEAKSLETAIQHLSQALGQLPLNQIQREWLKRIEQGAPESAQVEAESTPARLSRDSLLRRRFPQPLRYVVDVDRVFFHGGGRELCFSGKALALVERLATSEPFVAGDALLWDSNLNWAEVSTLLQQLLEARLLVFHEP